MKVITYMMNISPCGTSVPSHCNQLKLIHDTILCNTTLLDQFLRDIGRVFMHCEKLQRAVIFLTLTNHLLLYSMTKY